MISAHHSLDGLYVFWLNCASVILGVVVFYVLFFVQIVCFCKLQKQWDTDPANLILVRWKGHPYKQFGQSRKPVYLRLIRENGRLHA